MIWEQRFPSGLKVQIPGYFSKSASVTLEIKKKKRPISGYELANQETANLLSPYWILNTGNPSVAIFALKKI